MPRKRNEPHRPVLERFYSHTESFGECLLWTGRKSKNGYGQFRVGSRGIDRRMVRAHKWIYEYLVGCVPDGLDLDHLCRNRACVNHLHLEPVTRRENLRRSPLSNYNKTHCKNGHEYNQLNTRIARNGQRVCRACDSFIWRAV